MYHHHQERGKLAANAHESQCANLSPAFNGQVSLSLSLALALHLQLRCDVAITTM